MHRPQVSLCLFAAAIALVIGACAPAGGTTESGVRSRSNRDVITAEEVQATNRNTVYEVVQRLHPQWLRSRGVATMDPGGAGIVVLLNGSRIGGISALRQIPANGVSSIEYVDGPTATQRWGTGFGHGAIVVSTAAR